VSVRLSCGLEEEYITVEEKGLLLQMIEADFLGDLAR
jgi:hypothetical protein